MAEKELSKFADNPEKYVSKSVDNMQKMPTSRLVKIGRKSLIVGTIAGLATVGISMLTGSNKGIAVATGVGAGLTVGGVNGMVEANNYGMTKQTTDCLKEGWKSAKEVLN